VATAEGWGPYFDAVRRFRVGADTVSRLVQEGRVRSKKVGRSRLFDPASLEEYLVEARAARKAEHGKLLREARARKMEEKIERRKAIHEMIRGLIAEDIEALEEFEALVHAASFVRRVK
jgi:excisionase family DNA binding protein